MKKTPSIHSAIRGQSGAIAVMVVVFLFVLIGIAAFAVDIGYHYFVRNELKNAADAGALAGTQYLYDSVTGMVNPGSNGIANTVATENNATSNIGSVPVEVSPDSDVQRGHWSFATGTFTPNDSTAATTLSGVTFADLDSDPDFINAMRVTTHRGPSYPLASWFASIFGYTSFTGVQNSVAWIGFAGTVPPGVANEPIAICEESITDSSGAYTCAAGRMLDSNSGSPSTFNTGAWTNFTQPCSGVGAASVNPLICGSGNPNPLIFGQPMSTNGGVAYSDLSALISCWQATAQMSAGVYKEWPLVLPVVNCSSNNANCSSSNPTTLEGLVQVNVLWINGNNPDINNDPPTQIYDKSGTTLLWSDSDPTGTNRWNSLVAFFNLQDYAGNPAIWQQKTIYFAPDCSPHAPEGTSGGLNFGILAKYPKLVQ